MIRRTLAAALCAALVGCASANTPSDTQSYTLGFAEASAIDSLAHTSRSCYIAAKKEKVDYRTCMDKRGIDIDVTPAAQPGDRPEDE